MRGILQLALNDLRLTVKDRASLIWLLLMPIGMMWFFGVVGDDGGPSAPPPVSLGIVDRDGGWIARGLVETLRDERLELTEEGSESEIVAGTPRALFLPAGFTAGLLAGEVQRVELRKAADSDGGFGQASEVFVRRAVLRTLAQLVELGAAIDEPDAPQRFRELSAREPLVALAVTAAGRGRQVPSGRAQSIPGITTMMVMMMTLIYGAVFLTLERQQGMLRRQATAPLTRRQIFAGKWLGRLLLASAQIVILVAAGRWLLGLRWGNSVAGLVLLFLSYAVCLAGLSTLLGSVCRSSEAASSVGWISTLVMAALGGCWWPSELMPGWLQTAAHAFPTAWAMDGFHALISFGRGVEAVLLPAAVLVAFGGVASGLGARFLEIDR